MTGFMRKGPSLICAVLLGFGLGFPASANEAEARKRLEGFDIAQEPSRSDWRFFLRTSEKSREELWTYHKKRGASLTAWSWGWRLGWVRVCTKSRASFCTEILQKALFDPALVVRAEAATSIGRRYERTQSAAVVKVLAHAYKMRENLRHGKPLYVQNRILYAIRQVGGGEAMKVATALAASHPESQSYWLRLSRG